ncbi:MAG: acyltransferase [Myxococcota bacterium]
MDLRGRLPGLSPAYFGNAVALVSLALDRDALDVAPVALLARQIHLAVARYDAARARAAVGAAAAFGATHAWDEVHLVDPRGGVLVSNLARAPLAQLDFGAGPPAAILPRTHCPRLVFVLPGRDGQVVLHAQAPRPLPPRRTGKPADVVPFRAR